MALLDPPGPFNFKKLLDWMSFFQDPVRNAATGCDRLRIFLRVVLKHNIYKVLTPAKRTTPKPKIECPA